MASCSNCGAGLGGQFCARCGMNNEVLPESSLGRSAPLEARATAARLAEKRHGVPALMSFFLPGLGQLIKGDLVGAVLPFVGGAVGLMLAISGVAIGIVLVPIVWIWSLHDAYTAPDGQTKRELKRLGNLAVLLACALTIAGCGSVTSDAESDGGSGGAAGKVGEASGGAGGISQAGTGGLGGASSCGTNTLCSDGICSSANVDSSHCGPACEICPDGQLCTNSACIYPSCGLLSGYQSCAPAGSIFHKSGYDCFSCEKSSGSPNTTECTFMDGTTGAQASGIGLCVASCSECS